MNQTQQAAPKRTLNPVQIIVILAVLIFAGVYLYLTFSPKPAKYGMIEAGRLGAHYSGEALIVRRETPFEADSVASISYLIQEGRLAERGAEICNVFSTGYSARELIALQDYRDQIRDYQLTLVSNETPFDSRMERVKNDVLARAREVRAVIGGERGNLITLQALLKTAINDRQDYIDNKYATDQRLSRLQDDAHAQSQRIDSWTKQYVATADGIISFYSDGYEYALNLDTAETFSPAQVRRMIRGERPTVFTNRVKTTIYRSVIDGEWMLLMLADDPNWNPVQGQTYQLQLERFSNRVVPAEVISYTRSGGELLVRLLVRAGVEPVLYMRSCSVSLGDVMTTLRVPARALYQQDNMDGVVVVQDGTGIFVPVSVVYREGASVYISPITAGLLSEGMTVLLF